MKNKVFIFIVGLLVGAIIASAGFLIFGGNKGKMDMKDFDPSKFQGEGMTPPNFPGNNDDSNKGKNRPSRDNNNVNKTNEENNSEDETV